MSILKDDFLFGEEKGTNRLDEIKRKLQKDRYRGLEKEEIVEKDENKEYSTGVLNKNRYKDIDGEANTSNKKDKIVAKADGYVHKELFEESYIETDDKDTEQVKKERDVIIKMQDAFNMEFSDEQLAIIKQYGTPLNVLSGAGSGKTTVLVAKMLYKEMVHGEKPLHMLAITFSRKAREEMEDRYKEMRRKLKLKRKALPTFRTFHALFLMLLQSMKKHKKTTVLEGNPYWRQLSSLVVAGEDNEKSRVLEEMFTYKGNLINKGLSKDGIEFAEVHYDNSYNFRVENYIRVMERYNTLKEGDGAIDFDDMQTIIYDEIIEKGNQEPVKAFQRVWGDGSVYIDEYQDISKIQRIIMDALIKDFNKFTVIGDDDQSIYSWRGSDPTHIIDFPYHYKNAERLKLAVNYRCKKNILEPILPSISQNKRRVDKDIRAYNEGGYVELLPLGNSYKPLIDKIKEEVDGYEGIMFSEVAILVRQNSQRTLITDALIERGMPVNIGRESSSLQNSALYKNLMEIIEMVKDKDNKLFVKHARKFMPQMSRGLVEKYVYKDETWYFDICEQMFYNVNEGTVKILKGIYETNNMHNALALVWKLVRNYYRELAKRGYGSYGRTMETVKYLLDISKGVSIERFKSVEERKLARIQLWIGSEEAIKVETLHSVKGLEYDTVYLVGVNNNVMPDMNRYNSYLNEDSLDVAEQYIEEERRLFYVGWTRARERLIVSYSKKEPSIFLNEIDMEWDKGHGGQKS